MCALALAYKKGIVLYVAKLNKAWLWCAFGSVLWHVLELAHKEGAVLYVCMHYVCVRTIGVCVLYICVCVLDVCVYYTCVCVWR